jgi:hypothetical protein
MCDHSSHHTNPSWWSGRQSVKHRIPTLYWYGSSPKKTYYDIVTIEASIHIWVLLIDASYGQKDLIQSGRASMLRNSSTRGTDMGSTKVLEYVACFQGDTVVCLKACDDSWGTSTLTSKGICYERTVIKTVTTIICDFQAHKAITGVKPHKPGKRTTQGIRLYRIS